MSTILIVDDMAIIREPIAAALRQKGFEVRCAANGREALSLLQVWAPDVMLLDIAMPEMDGLSLLRAMQANRALPQPQVILLTAVTERGAMVEASNLGIRDYLLKSAFSINELLTRINRLLGQRSGEVVKSASGDVVPKPSPSKAQPLPGLGALSSPGCSSLACSSTHQTPSPTTPVTPPPSPPAAAAASVVAPPVSPTQPSPHHQITTSPLPPASDPDPAALFTIGTIPDTGLDALKLIRPVVPRSRLDAILNNCGELKSFSPTVSQILKLTGSANCSLEQVAKAIHQDQGLTLKILKLANSVVYTRGEPVDSVQKAVARIGLAPIRQAVLNVAIIDSVDTEGLGQRLNSAQFWEHAIACGLIAAEITHELNLGAAQADVAFTMGLLHDVGRMVYVEHLREEYAAVLETADRLKLPLEMVESRMFLLNHADAMDRILRAWRFPKDLINPIAMHHLSMGNIRQLAPKMVNEIAILALANRLAHALLLGNSGNLTIYPTHDLAQGLRLSPKLFERVQQEIPDETDDVKFTMLLHASQRHWPAMRDQVRRQVHAPFLPVFLAHDAGLDAFGLLCASLSQPTPDGQPNLAVVHIRHIRERQSLSRMLADADAAAGKRLPAILLSATGLLSLDPAALANRPVELLGYPLVLARFLATINQLLAQPGTLATAA